MTKNKTEYEIEQMENLSQNEINRKLLERLFALEKESRRLKMRIKWDESVLREHNVLGFRDYVKAG